MILGDKQVKKRRKDADLGPQALFQTRYCAPLPLW